MFLKSIQNFFFLRMHLGLKSVEEFLLIIKHLISFVFFIDQSFFQKSNFLLKLCYWILVNMRMLSCLIYNVKFTFNCLWDLIHFEICIVCKSLKSFDFLNQAAYLFIHKLFYLRNWYVLLAHFRSCVFPLINILIF